MNRRPRRSAPCRGCGHTAEDHRGGAAPWPEGACVAPLGHPFGACGCLEFLPRERGGGTVTADNRREQAIAAARAELGRAWDAWSAVVAGEVPGDAEALYREIEVRRARIAELGGGGP